jgi:uncharacterized phage-associated protein
MADTMTVANRFLSLAEERGATLSPMQLLKLVYIAHGWTLALYGRPLIRDKVEAWQYGPVIPKLYNRIRHYRGGPVADKIAITAPEGLTPEEDSMIVQVDKIYGGMNGPQLSRLTHAPGTPWAQTYKAGDFGITIPDDTIRDHYVQLAHERRNAQ